MTTKELMARIHVFVVCQDKLNIPLNVQLFNKKQKTASKLSTRDLGTIIFEMDGEELSYKTAK